MADGHAAENGGANALEAADRDHSGRSLSGLRVEGSHRESFFNEADLTECVFAASDLSNSEFAESRLVGCRFEGANLSG